MYEEVRGGRRLRLGHKCILRVELDVVGSNGKVFREFCVMKKVPLGVKGKFEKTVMKLTTKYVEY